MARRFCAKAGDGAFEVVKKGGFVDVLDPTTLPLAEWRMRFLNGVHENLLMDHEAVFNVEVDDRTCTIVETDYSTRLSARPIADWAQAQGLTVDYVELPRPPDAPQIVLPTREALRIPAFQFTYNPGARTPLHVDPTGFKGVDLERLSSAEPWAVGDIFCRAPNEAIAHFAICHDVDRLQAEAALREWGEWDGWGVMFQSGLTPLARLDASLEMRVMSMTCCECGAYLATGLSSHYGFRSNGRISTRCREFGCNGRVSWLKDVNPYQ